MKSKIRIVRNSKWKGPWTLAAEAWRLNMMPWRVCRPVFADSHHIEEKQDPNSDPHLSKKSNPGPHSGEKRDPERH